MTEITEVVPPGDSRVVHIHTTGPVIINFNAPRPELRTQVFPAEHKPFKPDDSPGGILSGLRRWLQR